jgi:hypothetical protein
MESSVYNEALLKDYKNRDVDAIIRTVSGLIKDPTFPTLYRRLVKEGKITSTAIRIEDVARVLLEELEVELQSSDERIVEDNFFGVAESLKKRFNDELSEIYINTKIPNEFLVEIRANNDRGDTSTLSEELVTRYKNELVRIENGRHAIVDILQVYTNFTIKNAKALSKLFEQLQDKLKTNYSYVSLKPYFASIYEAGGAIEEKPKVADTEEEEESTLIGRSLFSEYINTGVEPTLIQQVNFRIAVNKLFQHLLKRKILSHKEHQQYWTLISKIFDYRCSSDITEKTRNFLEELLEQVNEDEVTILKQLALTFVDQYHSAEEQMKLRHNMITKELAYTQEFLKQFAQKGEEREEEDEEKIRIALEKIVGLDGIFVIPPSLEDAAIQKSFSELERSALGIATVITPSQITEWIKIYSILFSNSEFLAYTQSEVDFSIMRKYISDLTTYHMILNISSLKTVIDQSLHVADEEKASHFKQFNDALKVRLQGLMGKKQKEVTSLQEMIKELSFLQNEATQFVIAETFKGFQIIVDAFNSTANEVFVRDREALLKESKELYTQICDQCMRNFVKRPMPRATKKKSDEPTQEKKSWLGKLFS